MNVSRLSNPRTTLPVEQERLNPKQDAAVQGPEQARPEQAREVEPKQAAERRQDRYQEQEVQAAQWAALGSQPAGAPLAGAAPVGLAKMEAAPSLGAVDGATGARAGGWSQATPVLAQTDATNCGATAAAMLVRAAGGGQGQTDTQLVKGLESKYSDSQGTTPDQMGKMLAGEGLEVTRGAANFDRDALDAALAAGKKAVALVDSNLIQEGAAGNKPGGSAHWVEIDGKDAQGNYVINDPASGKSQSVGLPQLTQAMNTGWSSFNGGGMLIVGPKGGDSGALAEQNANHSATLGKTPGIGSPSSARGARESGS